jgi:hypothetical protein
MQRSRPLFHPQRYNVGMFRLLLLTLLAGLLLSLLCWTPQQPVLEQTSGMQSPAPKQPQMEVPSAVPSPTASQLQTTHVVLHKVEISIVAADDRAGRVTAPVIQTLRDSIQASTVLRI